MINVLPYETVQDFQCECLDGKITGYAAPRKYIKPCLLSLRAGDVLIKSVSATRYNQQAKDKGFNYGWCGFSVDGLIEGFGIQDELSLVDEVSGSILLTLNAEDYIDQLLLVVRKNRRLTTDMLRKAAVEDVAAPDMESILPFAVDFYQKFGATRFVDAAYKTFLGRPADGAAPMDLPNASDELGKRVRDYLFTLVNSGEYKSKNWICIPGPFHSAFQFRDFGL